MDIKEKLNKGWNWTKDHRWEIALGGLTLLSGMMICRNIGKGKAAEVPTEIPTKAIQDATELMSEDIWDLHPDFNLNDIGICDYAVVDDGLVCFHVNLMDVKDLGTLGEKIIERTGDLIDQTMAVDVDLTFNVYPGD